MTGVQTCALPISDAIGDGLGIHELGCGDEVAIDWRLMSWFSVLSIAARFASVLAVVDPGGLAASGKANADGDAAPLNDGGDAPYEVGDCVVGAPRSCVKSREFGSNPDDEPNMSACDERPSEAAKSWCTVSFVDEPASP